MPCDWSNFDILSDSSPKPQVLALGRLVILGVSYGSEVWPNKLAMVLQNQYSQHFLSDEREGNRFADLPLAACVRGFIHSRMW